MWPSGSGGRDAKDGGAAERPPGCSLQWISQCAARARHEDGRRRGLDLCKTAINAMRWDRGLLEAELGHMGFALRSSREDDLSSTYYCHVDNPANTTLPKGRSSIRWRRAAAASSSLYARSTTGFTLPEVSSGRMTAHAAAFVACDRASREKPLKLARLQIKSVTSIVVFRPAEYPNEVRTPPTARVASACPVRAPPTLSMTTSTPRPPVRRATPSVRLPAERSMTVSKPRARACSALAGLVVVEIAFAAPRARANWVTALPTAPPIAGARTVLPGSKPACVSVICAVR